MKALILDGKVVDIVKTEFEVHSSMSWVDCDDKVAVGWTYDGKTFKTNVVELTAEEKLTALRIERNKLLNSSDWVVIKEREEGGSVSNFADWKKYRQELRDITKTYKSLEDVKWPTAPSE